MITYLDRACFPNVQGDILTALKLQSIDQLKLALTAFQLAYALFEVPTGYLGDRFGPRKTLVRIVLWWSFFVALTGLVGYEVGGMTLVGFWTLVAIRFLFGMGEAGAYPNIARALYNWFPLSERGKASGLVWMSARLMGGLTPLTMTLLMHDLAIPWRGIFFIFGGAGVVWCIAFLFWFRNHPEENPKVNAAELAHINAEGSSNTGHTGVPWRKLLTNRSLWSICLMYWCINYSWYFSMNYLPKYLEEQHSVQKDSRLGAIYKGGPLLLGMVGCFAGGILTDRFIRRTGNKRWGRRVFGMLGHALAACCLFVCGWMTSALGFAVVIALSGFFNDLTMASAWAACQDVGRKYAAIVSGFMNMIGNLGGAITTYVTGWILTYYKDQYVAANGLTSASLTADQIREAFAPGWQLNFILYGIVYLLAVVFWLGLNADKPIDDDLGKTA
jgi:MFS family permease